MYSKGLRDAVARLLVVEPQRRASVQEILSMEAVAANRNQIPQAPPAAGEAIVSGVDIVRTIQVPHRFNDLTKALPPSRYDKPLGNPNPYPNPNPNSNPNPNPNPDPNPNPNQALAHAHLGVATRLLAFARRLPMDVDAWCARPPVA